MSDAEGVASYYYSLHELGYTFNGDAALGGLLPIEADTLLLGHLVHNQPNSDATGTDSLAEQKATLRENHAAETEHMIAEITG